jgi:hypothetical protein
MVGPSENPGLQVALDEMGMILVDGPSSIEIPIGGRPTTISIGDVVEGVGTFVGVHEAMTIHSAVFFDDTKEGAKALKALPFI